jgi:hypothetical protein
MHITEREIAEPLEQSKQEETSCSAENTNMISFKGTVLRPNSWTKSRQKSSEFSSLLFKINSIQLWLEILFLQTHTASYSFYSVLLYTVKETGKPDGKPHPLSCGFRIMPRNLKEIVCSIRLLYSCFSFRLAIVVHVT